MKPASSLQLQNISSSPTHVWEMRELMENDREHVQFLDGLGIASTLSENAHTPASHVVIFAVVTQYVTAAWLQCVACSAKKQPLKEMRMRRLFLPGNVPSPL